MRSKTTSLNVKLILHESSILPTGVVCVCVCVCVCAGHSNCFCLILGSQLFVGLFCVLIFELFKETVFQCARHVHDLMLTAYRDLLVP